MKKILLFAFALFIGALSYGQNISFNASTYKGMTTTQRDNLSTTSVYPVLYNTTTGQYERWNGSAYEVWDATFSELNNLSTVTWVNVPDANITESSVTQHEAALTIVSSNITDGTITALDIGNNAVTTGEILDDSVTLTKMATGSVASDEILDGEVGNADLADNAVNSAKINDGTVGTLDLANNSILEADLNVDSAPTDGYVLTYDSVGANFDWLDPSSLGGSGDDVSTFSEKTGALVGTDRLVGLSTATDFNETISGIPLSIFNDDLTHTTDTNLDIDTSAKLAAIVGDETGSGALVFGTSPTFVTPVLGTPSSGVGTNLTALTAANVDISDIGSIITATDVEGALAENRTQIDINTATEGFEIKSTAETGAVKFLREDGDDSSSWQLITSASITDGTIVNADIANDTIAESKLEIFNAPIDGYHLGYDSVNGMQWEVDAGGGGDIYLHPNSDVSIDSIYVGTAAQIAARPLGTDVLSFATDATIQLTDLTDVNTATVTNKNVLVADGVDFESRALTVADITFSSEVDLGANSIGATAQSATGDGTTTITWANGNLFNFQFGAFNETFTFTAPTNPGTFVLKLVQDSTGSRTATWPGTVEWPGGTAPTLTTTATTGTDIMTFYYDGTGWFGVSSLDFQ